LVFIDDLKNEKMNEKNNIKQFDTRPAKGLNQTEVQNALKK